MAPEDAGGRSHAGPYVVWRSFGRVFQEDPQMPCVPVEHPAVIAQITCLELVLWLNLVLVRARLPHSVVPLAISTSIFA